MKPVVILAMIVFALFLQQQRNVEPEDCGVTVVRFSWAKERSNNLIRGAQNPGGPIVTPSTNGQDLDSRRVEMHGGEQKAALSSAEQLGNRYHLRLEVKNTGPNVVKSLAWESRPTEARGICASWAVVLLMPLLCVLYSPRHEVSTVTR